MSVAKKIRIVAMGNYMPALVESTDLEEKLGIPKGWSLKYSGVKMRHHVKDECNGDMGAIAADRALLKAGMKLSEMDMLISANGTFDYPIPNQASIIKCKMQDGNESNTPAIDIDSTCLSFVAAFDIAASLLDGVKMKNVLVVSTEISSNGLSSEDWETATLFGDGAVAAIISYDAESGSEFIKGLQKTYSEGVYLAIVKGGGNKFYAKENPYDKDLYAFQMEGKKLLRLAKKKIPEFMDEFFNDLPMTIEDIKAVIPHQASKIGLQIFKNLYAFKDGQVKETLEYYGNCIAASIPLTLYDAIEKGEIKRGDTCLLCGTSSGFSIAAVLIKY